MPVIPAKIISTRDLTDDPTKSMLKRPLRKQTASQPLQLILDLNIRFGLFELSHYRKRLLVQRREPVGEDFGRRHEKPGCPAIAALEPCIESSIGKLSEVGVCARNTRGTAWFTRRVDPFRQ